MIKYAFCESLPTYAVVSKLAPNLVYHGLIRALLSLALNIMSVQLTLAAGKDQLTPGKSGTYICIYLLFFFFP